MRCGVFIDAEITTVAKFAAAKKKNVLKKLRGFTNSSINIADSK